MEDAAALEASPAPRRAAGAVQVVDPEAPDLSEQRFTASLDTVLDPMREVGPDPEADLVGQISELPAAAADTASREEFASEPTPGSPQPGDAWRDELSARLNRYRARRKMRPPRYPSLQLPFEAGESSGGAGLLSAPSSSAFAPMSDRALALDGMREMPSAAEGTGPQPAEEPVVQTAAPAEAAPAERCSAKILEFPRFAWGPPPPPDDQLAEPVTDRPRILEVPEATPPPPALGGITIEVPERKKAEKRPGIDFPLQAASLSRRTLAGGVDGLMVVAASAFFGGIFWRVTGLRPPLIQILALAATIPCLCWAVYQYLLIVYTGGTTGLRAAELELARFDGIRPSRSLRRWRVLASYLSAAALGMGYLWVFLDEDALCWHDRITHTYLAPKAQTASPSKPAA